MQAFDCKIDALTKIPLALAVARNCFITNTPDIQHPQKGLNSFWVDLQLFFQAIPYLS
jgi:hypothetical protein